MTKLFSLKGKVQNYAWGGFLYIPNLLGEESTEEKCAEYWLGAHDNAPSTVIDENGVKEGLNSFLREDLERKLGSVISKKFGRLPFLFKVLDVADMLSIQVHPSKKEAEKGFKLENEKGIPLDAFNRNYKDDNHKPEIMVALSEFWLLHGFLPKDKLSKLLDVIPEFNVFRSIFDSEGYYGLYKTVMEQSQEEVNKTLMPLVNRIYPLYKEGKLDKSSPDYWAAKAVDSAIDSFVFDRGIYSIYFFNIVKVNPGEAVFQDAGIPHAYLEGQNMELMANSDNVLRGGLTPKHIDVSELLKHVTFEETIPNILKGELQSDGLERIYKSPAPDFELSQITLKNNETYIGRSKTVEILIVMDGSVSITEGDTHLDLKKGEVATLTASSNYEINTSRNTVLYKATAP